MISTGFGSYINEGMIIAIGRGKPRSSPLNKLIREKENKGEVINFTTGHKLKSVVFFTSGQAVLSAIGTETLVSRINNNGVVA